MISIEDFDPSLLKQTNCLTKTLVFTTLDTLQLEIINDYENIHSVNPLYLMIGKVIGHIECNSVEAKNKSKYLGFTSSNESKEKLKNTQNFGIVLKMRLRQ